METTKTKNSCEGPTNLDVPSSFRKKYFLVKDKKIFGASHRQEMSTFFVSSQNQNLTKVLSI